MSKLFALCLLLALLTPQAYAKVVDTDKKIFDGSSLGALSLNETFNGLVKGPDNVTVLGFDGLGDLVVHVGDSDLLLSDASPDSLAYNTTGSGTAEITVSSKGEPYVDGADLLSYVDHTSEIRTDGASSVLLTWLSSEDKRLTMILFVFVVVFCIIAYGSYKGAD